MSEKVRIVRTDIRIGVQFPILPLGENVAGRGFYEDRGSRGRVCHKF